MGTKGYRNIISIFLMLALTACESKVTLQATTASPTLPAAAPPLSGEQICAPASTMDCNALAKIWLPGKNAVCNSAGSAYTVTSCVRAGDPNGRVKETIYPAQRNSRWANAKCSKSGDFVFEVSMPAIPSNDWVISLQGGGQCAFDGNGIGGCSNRAMGLVAPYDKVGPFPPNGTLTAEGPLNDPDFANANWAYGHYCSNDGWMGSNVTGVPMHYTADGSFANWSFTGHLNVVAMLDLLAERYGLDDSNPNMAIFFQGQSAGGMGTAQNAFTVHDRFPQIASRGNLLVSSWQMFIPTTWDMPDFWTFGIVGDTALEAYDRLRTTWQAVLTPNCVADHLANPALCMTAPGFYEYITGSPSGPYRGMDLPLFIYQNRQDQLYMGNTLIPAVSAGMTVAQSAARTEWVRQMNLAMGINPLVPNASSRIKWLFAPSDPQATLPNGSLENNVHGALDYQTNAPGGVANSLTAMHSRFWATRGRGPGRGQLPGEVITYDCNWVPSHVCAGF